MNISDSAKQNIIALLKECQFRELADQYFDEKFHWEIKGSSVISGEYHDKNAFFELVIDRLSSLIKPGWKMHILNVITADSYCIVEMKGEAELKTGGHYNNEYCWILHFNQHGKIDKVTAYYDSLLVNQVLGDKA